MPAKNKPKKPSPEAVTKLRELVSQVGTGAAYRRIVSRVLSKSERRELEANPAEETIIDFWCRLKGVAPERAAIDLGHAIGLIEDSTQDWLLREIGEGQAVPVDSDVPAWNRALGELSFRGQVVRRIPSVSVAKNIVAILDRFQKLGWPVLIDDPLPNAPDSQRKRETVLRLNKGLKRIRFHSAGTVIKIRWAVR
jgi:hypothetical protein